MDLLDADRGCDGRTSAGSFGSAVRGRVPAGVLDTGDQHSGRLAGGGQLALVSGSLRRTWRSPRLQPGLYRARPTSENTTPEAEAESDDAQHPGPESMPDDADPVGDISEINSPSAHALLTQTAPDEESEAE